MLLLQHFTKQCGKCHILKYKHEFNINKSKKDGFQNRCRECSKNYYIKNIETITQQHKDKYQLNKEKISEKTKEYRANNQEKIITYRKINKKDRAEKRKIYVKNNKDKIKNKQQEYRANNKKELSEYHKKYLDKYYQTEKGKAVRNNSTYKRRSLKKHGDVTSTQIMELKLNAKSCYWCESSLKSNKIHIDHYIPLSKGGEHTLSNLVVSCDKCNMIKNAKDPIVFANSIGKLF